MIHIFKFLTVLICSIIALIAYLFYYLGYFLLLFKLPKLEKVYPSDFYMLYCDFDYAFIAYGSLLTNENGYKYMKSYKSHLHFFWNNFNFY